MLARSEFGRRRAPRRRTSVVLDAMPRVWCYQRRKRDRCLSCMCERSRIATESSVDYSKQKDDDEASEELSALYEHTRDILRSVENTGAKKHAERTEQTPDKRPLSSTQAELQNTLAAANYSKVESSSRPANGWTAGSRASSSVSLSPQRSKLPADAQTSDEETSSPSALDHDDPSRYKNTAPCHLPTVLLPSMQPLRALRHRTPTTLESRIAQVQDATSANDRSDDECKDDGKVDPPRRSRAKANTGQPDDVARKKNHVASTRPLWRTKSEPRWISPRVPPDDTLKRSDSCASIVDLSRSTTGTSGKGGNVTPPEAVEAAWQSPQLPLLRLSEISRFLRPAIRREESAATMLRMLADEFARRVAERPFSRRGESAARLTRLLADAKRYLSPGSSPSHLLFSAKQPASCNSRLLRRALPEDSYNLVAPLLGMPTWNEKRVFRKAKTAVVGYESETTDDDSRFDVIVHPPTTKGISTNGEDDGKADGGRSNPYAAFLRKPRRKVVTWRPLTAADLKGYDPQATLQMRARNVTDGICRDFCQWLRGLGGVGKVIDEQVLRDMFEIDFSAEAGRTMQMSTKEMPMVPNDVAVARQCPDAGELAMTRKQLMRDARAESKPTKTMAFGTMIPWHLQYSPPKNRVRKRWLRCENAMPDLETMNVVWKNITHLESVEAFARWIRDRPEISLPDALTNAAIDRSRRVPEDEAVADPQLDAAR